jgi:hypothetical protein
MSNYAAFDCVIDNNDGSSSPVPLTTVNVYDVTGAAALADLTTDAAGHIPAGTVPIAAGSIVRFSFKLTDGRCGYAEVVTT